MARTQIPDLVSERLANRISVLMLSEANGAVDAGKQIGGIVWTLGVVGFNRDVIETVLTAAAENADLDTESAVGGYLPKARSQKGVSDAPVSG